jgi:hypothetical protein
MGCMEWRLNRHILTQEWRSGRNIINSTAGKIKLFLGRLGEGKTASSTTLCLGKRPRIDISGYRQTGTSFMKKN